jgi:hypothetical protein
MKIWIIISATLGFSSWAIAANPILKIEVAQQWGTPYQVTAMDDGSVKQSIICHDSVPCHPIEIEIHQMNAQETSDLAAAVAKVNLSEDLVPQPPPTSHHLFPPGKSETMTLITSQGEKVIGEIGIWSSDEEWRTQVPSAKDLGEFGLGLMAFAKDP